VGVDQGYLFDQSWPRIDGYQSCDGEELEIADSRFVSKVKRPCFVASCNPSVPSLSNFLSHPIQATTTLFSQLTVLISIMSKEITKDMSNCNESDVGVGKVEDVDDNILMAQGHVPVLKRSFNLLGTLGLGFRYAASQF
jgi:hypothetical protein